MKKNLFFYSSTFGITCLFMYILIEIVEQLSLNILLAYMTTSSVSFSYDIFTIDFTNLKIMVGVIAIFFGGLSLFSLLTNKE